MATIETLLTAEEFQLLPADLGPLELYRGQVIEMNVPTPRHGQVCSETCRVLANYVRERGIGRVVSNDSGIVTEQNPDSVRGADVAFYSYARLPKGPLPTGYLTVVPEVVFEVLSPSDRWPEVLTKTAEYLKAGVIVVCILDPDAETAQVFRCDRPVQIVTADQELTLPDLLGEFRVVVGTLFE